MKTIKIFKALKFDVSAWNGSIINKKTRVTRDTATAIDDMFTNSIINTETNSVIIKADVSDHFPTLFLAKVNVDLTSKQSNTF